MTPKQDDPAHAITYHCTWEGCAKTTKQPRQDGWYWVCATAGPTPDGGIAAQDFYSCPEHAEAERQREAFENDHRRDGSATH